MQTDTIFKRLNAFKIISPGFKEYLLSCFIVSEFDEQDTLPYRPPISNTIYFIEQGMLEQIAYYRQQKKTLAYYSSTAFLLPDFGGQAFMVSKIHFLQASVLIGLELSDALEALNLFPEAAHLFIYLQDEALQAATERQLLLGLPAKERFAALFIKHPQLYQHGTAASIASYLHISLRQYQRLKAWHSRQ